MKDNLKRMRKKLKGKAKQQLQTAFSTMTREKYDAYRKRIRGSLKRSLKHLPELALCQRYFSKGAAS